jgi:hypothetical protein
MYRRADSGQGGGASLQWGVTRGPFGPCSRALDHVGLSDYFVAYISQYVEDRDAEVVRFRKDRKLLYYEKLH